MKFESTENGFSCILSIKQLEALGFQGPQDLQDTEKANKFIHYLLHNASLAGIDTQPLEGKQLSIGISINPEQEKVKFDVEIVNMSENDFMNHLLQHIMGQIESEEDADECDEIDVIDDSKESITICCEFKNLNDIFIACNVIKNINTNVELFKYKNKYHMILTVGSNIANKLCLMLSEFCVVNTNILKATLIKEHGKPMGEHNITQLAVLA